MILDILNIGSKIIDKIFPDANAAEAAKLKLLELQQSGQLAQLNADMQEQQELTKRQAADMASDSWLSKNIRPMSLCALFAAYIMFALMSTFDLDTNESYTMLLGQWGQLAFGFYFGSRGLEKIAEMKYKAKDQSNK
jgi:uncharacterized membrane protein (DUF106 family)